MVPITGIGWTSIEIALVSYTLLILFRNTLTGLREVPDRGQGGGRGHGPDAAPDAHAVELPLAVPAIIAGLRVATVTTISLATVAAFITPLGLGAPIFSAIQTGANTEFVAASLLAIALALIADALIVTTQRIARRPWTRARRRSTMSDLINFYADNASLMLQKTLAHIGIAGARDRRSRSSSRCRSASALGHRHARLVPGDQHLQRPPRAAEPRADRDQPRPFRLSLLNIEIALVALASRRS